ncbi:MAG: uroporphyrinogen-III synthase, partial [Thermomicrobiales bacterium]
LTSVNAVDAVGSRAHALGLAVADLQAVRVAAVGAATAQAAREAGFAVEIRPAQATAQALAAALLPRLTPDDRVLFPRSATGREDFPAALRGCGVPLHVVDAYRTLPETHSDPVIHDLVRNRQVDALLFSSPSAISGLRTLLGDGWSAAAAIPAVCAGTVTAEAARTAGFAVAAVSRDPGAEAIADAVAEFWTQRRVLAEPVALSDSMYSSERMAGR